MKIIPSLALFLAIGCILAAGCVAQTKKETVNSTTAVTANSTFAPFTNTSDPRLNQTINATANVTVKPPIKGPLRVSISGYPVELDVLVDNITVGQAKPSMPLDLMVDEGLHNVTVCVGWICEHENITARFGKQVTVDFGERLRKVVEFPEPTARILEYFKNGYGLSVKVEFINPSKKDLLMSAEVSCGYSYIDDRTSIKMGDSVRGNVVQYVKAGERVTDSLDLYFVSGHAYSYDVPRILSTTIR